MKTPPPQPNPFESELQQFSPLPPSRDLSQAIAHQLAHPLLKIPTHSPNDRLLTTAITMGLAAAVAIVAMLSADFSSPNSTPQSSPTLANYPPGTPTYRTHELLAQWSAGQDPFNDRPTP